MVEQKLKTEWNDVALLALREQFNYNAITGDIVRARTGRTVPKTPASHGYSQVECSFGGRRFVCTQHALAWFLVHGTMPVKLDHENGVRTDNRLINLRASNNSHNSLNRRKKSGVHQSLPPGIYERPRKGRPGLWFECKIQLAGKTKGTYKRNKEDAISWMAFHRKKFVQLASP